MPYYIAIYDWSTYTLPTSIPYSDITGDSHANDPASADYSSGSPTWIGPDKTFTYNGGASTLLAINDDDGDFEDGYVETGGAQTLAQAVTINGKTYPAGSLVENEFSLLDAGGNEIWVVRIAGENVGFSYPAGQDPSPGDEFTAATGRDGAPVDSGDGVGSAEAYSAMICFAPGARIETKLGPRPVETLREGDLVQTMDNGARPVRWCWRRAVTFRNGDEDAKPVLIRASAFSPGLPERDLIVSPQHRFVFRNMCAPGHPEVFVPARALVGLPRVRSMLGKRRVEYVHFALDRHEVVFVDGIATESCFLGPVMLDSLDARAKARLDAVFPAVARDRDWGYGQLARPALRTRAARRMVQDKAVIPLSVTA